MDMPTEQRVHRFSRALEWNVRPGDSVQLADLLHRDVWRSTGARRPISDLAGIRLGVRKEFLERFPGRITAHRDAERVAADADDVGEILCRIDRGFAQERIAEHRKRDLRNRVAVGIPACAELHRRKGRAGARPVLDHERLPEVLLGRAGERAENDVARAAGGHGTISVTGRVG